MERNIPVPTQPFRWRSSVISASRCIFLENQLTASRSTTNVAHCCEFNRLMVELGMFTMRGQLLAPFVSIAFLAQTCIALAQGTINLPADTVTQPNPCKEFENDPTKSSLIQAPYDNKAGDDLDAFTQYRIARCLLSKEAELEAKLAVEWLRKSAEKSFDIAQRAFCRVTTQDRVALLACLKKFAELGNNDLRYEIGRDYADGEIVDQDYKLAFQWIIKAADAGHVPSQIFIGWLYSNGKGVEKSPTEAVKWWKRAADQNSGLAHWNLAIEYSSYEKLSDRQKIAFDHFLKAAGLGYRPAAFHVAWALLHGLGTNMNLKEAARWLRIAANDDNAEAQRLLALMYLKGDGVDRDLAEAYAWITLSQENARSFHSRRIARGAADLIRNQMDPKDITRGIERLKELKSPPTSFGNSVPTRGRQELD